MKKVLFLNGGRQFAHSDGRYNATLHEAGVAFMDRAGYDVKETFIDGGYDVAEEVQKFLWADVIVWQMPGWWMGAPWTVKKYIDEVFTEGLQRLCEADTSQLAQRMTKRHDQCQRIVTKGQGLQVTGIYSVGHDPDVCRPVTQRMQDAQAGLFLKVNVDVGMRHQKIRQSFRQVLAQRRGIAEQPDLTFETLGVISEIELHAFDLLQDHPCMLGQRLARRRWCNAPSASFKQRRLQRRFHRPNARAGRWQ